VLAGRQGLGFDRSFPELAAAPREETVYRPTLPAVNVASLYAGWHNALHQVLAT